MLEISVMLDAEPEGNETFRVTLSSPTGGARLGDQLQTLITVLENLAPSGLFRIGPSLNRSEHRCIKTIINFEKMFLSVLRHSFIYLVLFILCYLYRTSTEIVAEEGGRAVFLTVSRSNGLESAVSVEWEIQSGTAVASGQTNKSLNFKPPQPTEVS